LKNGAESGHVCAEGSLLKLPQQMFVELGFMLVLNFLYIQRWVFESNTVPLGQLTHWFVPKSKKEAFGQPIHEFPL
jgi:hypothetical protein